MSRKLSIVPRVDVTETTFVAIDAPTGSGKTRHFRLSLVEEAARGVAFDGVSAPVHGAGGGGLRRATRFGKSGAV